METLGSTPRTSPRLSVIVPVRDGAWFLAQSLPALTGSDLDENTWELIVVDDASHDGSADVAAGFADLVVRLPESGGPGAARNHGVRQSRGDILYRNLLHHRVHAEARGDAETFWAGLGAIRRSVFTAAGQFDETMRQLEDIDLGYRMRALGHRILLQPDIQGTHLKRWTLRSMVLTDLLGRGVTWMRLYLEQGRTGRPGTLNLRPMEMVNTLLAAGAAGALGVAVLGGGAPWLAAAVLCLLLVMVGNLPLFRWFARERGLRFAVLVVPLRLLYYLLNAIAAPLGLVQHLVAPRHRTAR